MGWFIASLDCDWSRRCRESSLGCTGCFNVWQGVSTTQYQREYLISLIPISKLCPKQNNSCFSILDKTWKKMRGKLIFFWQFQLWQIKITSSPSVRMYKIQGVKIGKKNFHFSCILRHSLMYLCLFFCTIIGIFFCFHYVWSEQD